MTISSLATLWEEKNATFLSESSDSVTIYYKPVRSGVSNTFDSFHQEAMNSANPSTFSSVITETTPSSVTVLGKTHMNMYGTNISGSESIQQINVGLMAETDVLFTCLLSSVLTITSPFKTKFHDCSYVTVEKDNNRQYEVVAIKTRGLGDAYLCDVFLKLTNK